MMTPNHVSQVHDSAESEGEAEDEVIGGGNEGRGQYDLEGGRGEKNPIQWVVFSRSIDRDVHNSFCANNSCFSCTSI